MWTRICYHVSWQVSGECRQGPLRISVGQLGGSSMRWASLKRYIHYIHMCNVYRMLFWIECAQFLCVYCVYTYIHIRVCIYIYRYTYIYLYTYTHTHTSWSLGDRVPEPCSLQVCCVTSRTPHMKSPFQDAPSALKQSPYGWVFEVYLMVVGGGPGWD